MAPASMKHAIIKNNVGFALRQALADFGCRALLDGPQILTEEISAIPDVVVTCIPIDLSTPVIAEPVVMVEAMSPSSEADDAGRNWFSDRKIPSLEHDLVRSQDERAVQVHSRAGDLWRERFIGAGALELDDPPLRLEVDAIYAGTELAAWRCSSVRLATTRPQEPRPADSALLAGHRHECGRDACDLVAAALRTGWPGRPMLGDALDSVEGFAALLAAIRVRRHRRCLPFTSPPTIEIWRARAARSRPGARASASWSTWVPAGRSPPGSAPNRTFGGAPRSNRGRAASSRD
jgi:hypothetical protein